MNKTPKMIRSIVLLLSIIVFPGILCADGEGTGDGIDAESLFPKTFKPLEPTMASLGRYGTYQVNLSSGLPQISFTLFEVNSGALSQPIILSYHGGGIKVSEEASWVGLGWDLSWGGSITRTVYGKRDEDENFANTPNSLTIRDQMDANPTDIYNPYLDALAEGFNYSYMQDQYQFNCPGGSGMFVLDNTNSPMLVPHQPLSVNFSGVTKQIKAPDQTSYLFKATDQTNVTKEIPYVSSWGIEKILSRDGKDMIEYSYQLDGKVSNVNSRSYDGYTFTSTPENSTYSRIGLQESTTVTEVDAQKPQFIYFRDGKLEFVLSNRYDIGIGNTAINNTAIKKLESIIVYRKNHDGTYTSVKQIQFYYSYFGTGNIPTTSNPALRLRLDRVTEKAGNEEKMIAAFQYLDGLPTKDSYSTDHWGYYNGATNNTPVVGFRMNYQYIDGATKSVSESHMKAGSLNRITYPTRGSSVFNWEANNVYTDNTIVIGAQNSTFSIKENDTPGYSTLNHSNSGEPDPDDPPGMLQKTLTINKTQTVNVFYNLFRSNPIVEHGADLGSLTIIDSSAAPGATPLFYENSLSNINRQTPVNLEAGKTYYITLQVNCNNVKGNLAFDYISVPASGNYQVGGLRIASIVNQDAGGVVVSTKSYKYTMPDNPSISSGYAKTDFSDVNYSTSQRSYLKWESEIQGEGPGNNLECRRKMVKKVVFYSDPVAGIYSSPVCYQYVKEFDSSDSIDNGYTLHQFSVCQDSKPTKDILISNEWKRGDLLQKKVFRNNLDGTYQLVQQTDNRYSLHPGFGFQAKGFKMYRLISKVETPCGTVYPYEDQITLNELYEPMNFYYQSAWKHQDTTIVINYFDGTEVVEKTLYTYNNPVHCKPSEVRFVLPDKTKSIVNTYFVNPDLIHTGLISNRKEKSDNTIIKEEDISYNSDLQPLVYKEIFGNPTDFNKYTYTYDAQKNMAEFTKENDISTVFIWANNRILPVAKIESGNPIGLTGITRNLIATYPFDLNGASFGAINDIAFLKEALNSYILNNAYKVTLFTYKPLIGLTSQTDPNGKTTFYEYDTFGRLHYIKDDQGKILKKTDYHFATPNP